MSVQFEGDNVAKWNVTILGPAGTPYEGGKFVVNVDFTDNYPFKAPKVSSGSR